MERFVLLPGLPDGLRFPDDLSTRIRFDGQRKRLVYTGFMSKADFDRLSRLSDDWGYRRGLEDLFRLCLPDEGRRPLFSRVLSRLGL